MARQQLAPRFNQRPNIRARSPADQRPASRRPSRNSRGWALYTIFFLVLSGLGALASQSEGEIGWAYGALAIYTVYSIGLTKFAPATFLLLSPFIALHFTEVLSGLAIESGGYMVETQTTGHPTGAFMRLTFVYIGFFSAAALLIETMWPRVRASFSNATNKWRPWALQCCLVTAAIIVPSVMYLLWTGRDNGFPLFTHTDRFDYMRDAASPVYKAIMLNRIVLMPLLGALLVMPRYRIYSIGTFLSIIAVSILFGEKFTSILMMICAFVMPLGLVHIANGGVIKLSAVGLVAGCIAVITVPAVLMVYGADKNLDQAIRKYNDRATLQGQLWFEADERYWSVLSLDRTALKADASSWFKPSEQTSQKAGTAFGLYYVMVRFTPDQTLSSDMDKGIGFVFSFYPYLLMATGVPGLLVVSTGLALYFSFLMVSLVYAVAHGRWLQALLYGRLASSFYALVSVGYLWDVVGIKPLATLAAAIALGLFSTLIARPAAIPRGVPRRAPARAGVAAASQLPPA